MDQSIVLSMNGWVTAHRAMRGLVTVIAVYGIYWLPLAVALASVWGWPAGAARRQTAVASVLAVLMALAMTAVLGLVVDRPRPFEAIAVRPLFDHAPDSSFPSHHTLIAAAIAGPFVWRMPALGVPMLLLALAVGVARVAAGVHYLSDIVWSASIGLTLAGAALLGATWLVGLIPTAWGRRLRLTTTGERPLTPAQERSGGPPPGAKL